MPVLATYFSVRRGRDPFFKFFMKTLFPRQLKDYEERFGIRFIGWYEGTRALGHRAGEWIFERHHSMFLRERMGPDLEYHP